jgi:hypothetical protein
MCRRPHGGRLAGSPFWVSEGEGLAGAGLAARSSGLASSGLGLILPGDVLSYRAMWDQYVLDTVSSGLYCGNNMQQVAAANPNNSQSPLLSQLGQTVVQNANDLLAKWNAYTGMSSAAILVNASDILQNEQQVVLEAGTQRQEMLANRGGSGGPISCGPVLIYQDANGNLFEAATSPDPSIQARVIANIEGLGILGSGLLQIFIDASASGIQSAGSAAKWIAQQGKTLIETTTGYLPWIIAGVAVIGAAGVALVYAPEIKGAFAAKRAAHRAAA